LTFLLVLAGVSANAANAHEAQRQHHSRLQKAVLRPVGGDAVAGVAVAKNRFS
jgi:hypothetical protein